MELSVLTADVQKLDARCELWALRAESTAWMDQWEQLLLSQVVVSQAQGNISRWKERALSLASVIPTHDALLQDTSGTLQSFSCRVAFLSALQSPSLKQRHWKDLLQGQLYDPEKEVKVSQLMSQQLDHTRITKVCRDAQVQSSMEQSFQKLRLAWSCRLFQLETFTLPGPDLQPDATVIITVNIVNVRGRGVGPPGPLTLRPAGLEVLSAEMESDVMSVSAMAASPHSATFRLQIQAWLRSVAALGKLGGNTDL
ncbi:hypothetical protein EYF80_057200 [Liparis tanakae]|uniref:Dynein heavy chain linker domain-containing protein n=1 Tax=Liparis tanakae TaxID=230148 RepID=A0A4Z2EV05_9TELE|nr:hypothetical protein EYF80_057200 [Liparis tanakae]